MDASLKRHPGLKPIARDHGVGLVFAERLSKSIRASRDDRARLAEQMRTNCRDVILQYLEDEESVLSRFITNESMLEEFMGKHTAVRAVSDKLHKTDLGSQPEMGLLARVSDALDDYIRWEERVLFPALEETLDDDQLEELSKQTANIEANRSRPTQQLHQSIALEKQTDLTDACGCAITQKLPE